MKHCILVKWKIRGEDVEPIKKLFEGALNVPGVNAVDYKYNCIDKENRYDLLIEIDIEKSAIESWNECETHKTWKATYGDKIASKAIFDFE